MEQVDNIQSRRAFNFSEDYQNRFNIFYDMMKFRVNEILLVSSLYDDFILEEDGRLTEELFTAFSELNLSSPPPRITRVSSANEALESIKSHEYDLIVTMRRLNDMNPFKFGSQIKEIKPNLPVVLLLTNQSDVIGLPPKERRVGIDEIFTFNGDSDIFLAFIKLVEDMKNIDQDTKLGRVRVIIVVEDTIQYYSIFLPIMFKELLLQQQELMEDGLNLSHRLLRRKARPKILLAKTYDEAIALYNKYKEYILGIITDVAFPMDGDEKDFNAGVKLKEYIRQEKRYLPILIQSSDPENYKLADDKHSKFVHKNSPQYLHNFRKFMKQSLLFGDFVFQLEDGTEVARADNVTHFEEVIKLVPAESIEYHGRLNHFSNWLYSRGEYQLAQQLAPYEVHEFDSLEAIRDFLVNAFEQRRLEQQKGIITEFTREKFDFKAPFTRLGIGSLGGKGRGIAFISSLLSRNTMSDIYENVHISIPETLVIATDLFDIFLEQNHLYQFSRTDISDEEVISAFIDAELPEGLRHDLWVVIRSTDQPLAVRSSSLLEDSQFHPLAGVYTTYMLANNQREEQVRYDYLCQAIKLVYASAFTNVAKSYINSLGQKIETEKMAVIIQKVVGNTHNEERFYPDFSGVTKSYNYYPIGYMKPEDGIAEVAVGLGEMVVSGGQSLSFSPKYPKILPNASTVDTALQNTQREFLAIDLNNREVELRNGEFSTLKKYDMNIAKEDGRLEWLAAVYDHQNNRIVNSIRRDGAILVTFPFVLKYSKFPLAQILDNLLTLGKETLGYSVEIEFAVNLDYEGDAHEFFILQIRPLVINEIDAEGEFSMGTGKQIISSDRTLGNGIFREINDLVFVKLETFDKTKTLQIREEISTINDQLKQESSEYILIGPGRWGTRDRFLGIPVKWNDIDAARIIIETSIPDFNIDPSQGMHFFVNITSTKRGYFTNAFNNSQAQIDWNWINEQTTISETNYVRHVRLAQPVTIRINGKTGQGEVVIEDTKEHVN